MENGTKDLQPVVGLKEWVISIIVSCLPVVGLIMLFVWAFSASEINLNKKNWAKAMLVVQLISIALVVLLYVFVLASALALRN